MYKVKNIISCFCFLLFANLLFGQKSNGSKVIVGKVGALSDSSHFKGIENVTIKLMLDSGLSAISSTESNQNGIFKLSIDSLRRIQSNKIKIEFSHLLYHTKRIEINNQFSDTLTLDKIILDPNSLSIDTVNVFFEKKDIELLNGKIIMNISKSAELNSLNASDLLRRVPGVMIDGSSISMMARTGVLLLVDGKKIATDTQQALNLIQSMPSNSIEKIEIISNPPAKYDADGYGGIINIIRKKSLAEGLVGNFNWVLQQGDYFKTTPGLNLDFNKNKLKATFIINTPYNKSGQSYVNNRILPYDQSLNQDMEIVSTSKGLNTLLNTTYEIDSNSTLGLSIGLNKFKNNLNFDGITTLIKKEKQQPDTLERSIIEDKTYTTTSFNIDYNKKRKRGGLNILGSYILYKNDQKTGYSTLDRNEQIGHSYFNILNPTKIEIKTFQVNMDQNILGGELNFGSKFSNITSKNNFAKDSLINGSWSNIANQTSNFRYNESNIALYSSFSKSIDTTLSAELGLRYEHTYSEGKLIASINDVFKNNYGMLFPNLSITKKIRRNKDLIKFSIGRRITRPNYKDLNPFLFYIDQYDYSSGNPYLKPSTATTIDFIYLLKGRIMLFLGYLDSKNEFQKIIEQDETTGIAIEKYENLAKYRAFSFNSTVPLNINKWWEMYNVFNISYRNYMSTFGDNRGTLIQFFTEQSFKLPKGISSYISFNYAAASAFGLYKIDPYWLINIGASKKLSKNMDLKFSITDLFKSNDRLTTVKILNIDQKTRNIYEGRIFQLSFSYKFGNKNLKTREGKTNSSEERSRL